MGRVREREKWYEREWLWKEVRGREEVMCKGEGKG